ncbi:hypothetical protein HQ945_09025 [Phyllobacterium sp. BT25]|uniref:Uncharacterized protein n=1 Tax=Phyllobacterium pellucidum TaxID=2740464 RepID=A0A849VQW3_9HYPH|nr:hypothetical protein [Phyllobacterium pellucidum]NTS31394.1 hypothetical protein [Phyllobacterium pellucidum]
MAYSKDTSVSVERTEGEIKSIIRKYGATSFASFESGVTAMIAFEMQGRRIVFKLPLPDKDAKQFRFTPGRGLARTKDQQLLAWEQACRSRWRALLLSIKAKLESVEGGIETFEDAFLAHIQMPDGLSVSEHVRPRIATAYETNSMQPLLPGPRGEQ